MHMFISQIARLAFRRIFQYSNCKAPTSSLFFKILWFAVSNNLMLNHHISTCTNKKVMIILLQHSHLYTVFILINAPGVLQFRSPKNDVLKTEYGQIYQHFNALKPFHIAFGHHFPSTKWQGALIREGAFIRINTVCKYLLQYYELLYTCT